MLPGATVAPSLGLHRFQPLYYHIILVDIISDAVAGSQQPMRARISLIAAILLGLTLLASGLGKLFADLPAETEFIDKLIPAFFMTPTLAYFIGYVLPWVELSLGILLILGIWPRLMAVLCLPLAFAFMANNSWMISQGMEEFPECAYCFGKLEEILGALSPLQSLCIDIGLFALALTIIFVRPGTFLSLPPWVAKLSKKGQAAQ